MNCWGFVFTSRSLTEDLRRKIADAVEKDAQKSETTRVFDGGLCSVLNYGAEHE
jgi:hypothetical protein